MSTGEFAEDQKPPSPRILVGVDRSDDAMRAVMYALGTAERTGHDIWLVHAVDDGVLTSGWGVVYDPTILSSVGEEALAVAKLFLFDNGFPADRVRSEVLMGHPTAVLADLSESAELCVVGRRAAGGLDRMFIGSTSLSLGGSAQLPCRRDLRRLDPWSYGRPQPHRRGGHRARQGQAPGRVGPSRGSRPQLRAGRGARGRPGTDRILRRFQGGAHTRVDGESQGRPRRNA